MIRTEALIQPVRKGVHQNFVHQTKSAINVQMMMSQKVLANETKKNLCTLSVR